MGIILMILISGCKSQVQEKKELEEEVIINKIEEKVEFSTELSDLINDISDISIVQSKNIGYGGTLSENYQSFEKIKKIATIKELVELTNNENDVIACYASWALVDNSYEDLDVIFEKFIQNNIEITFEGGCTIYPEKIYHLLYSRYYKKNFVTKEVDRVFIKLDSLTLYNHDTLTTLVYHALDNRYYDRSYNKQISSLAFDKMNMDAVFYLAKWYKAEYSEELKTSLTEYLNETTFSENELALYFKTVKILLDFNDDEIDTIIREKINTDTSWLKQKEKFKYLFEDMNFSTMRN